MRRWAVVLLTTALGLGTAWAEAPEQSPRPQGRPTGALAATAVTPAQALDPPLRPLHRPAVLAAAVALPVTVALPGVAAMPRPKRRPAAAAVAPFVAPAATFAGLAPPRPRPRPARPTVMPTAMAASLPAALTEPAPFIAPASAFAGLAQLRPRPRPASFAVPAATFAGLATPALPRPRSRPAGLQIAALSMLAPAPQDQGQSPRRGKDKKAKDRATNSGFVCDDPKIRGENLARITSRVQGCGVAEPVRVTQIDGVRLSQPATLDCDTAIALKRWIGKGVRPAFGGREVVELRIAAHYICRPRNNVRGNKISEHGRGKAIDIAGFIFSDGKQWSVAQDYNLQIRKAHKAACGIFGTTLGPGSDGYHEDHLHFDTASQHNGPYCR